MSEDNLFDDSASNSEAEGGEFAAGSEGNEAGDGKDPKDGAGEVGNESGEGNEAGTPPANEGNESADGKMIPEHRFKAALKEVNDKLHNAETELAKVRAVPVPDKEKDPAGYDLHVRMEASKEVMREMRPDYKEVIEHYQKMADANPALNQHVANAPLPAKFAYDLAKKDMELSELASLKDSDDFKEYQAWKKANSKQQSADAAKVGKKVADALGKVPNLNRATNVNKGTEQADESDELFSGAL